jgi:putative DNA primase/helicase
VLTEDTSAHKALLLIGPPRCGKGTIGRTLTSLLGPEHVCAPSLTRMGNQFGLQQFLGKSLAIVGDAESSVKAAAAAVDDLKVIIGEDTVTVHRKNRDDWVGRLGVRLMLAANVIPAFLDPSGALAERLMPIKFAVSFAGREDTSLEEKLAAELPGILNWAIEGLADLVDNGKVFAEPSGSAEMKKALRMDFSPIREFLTECCERVSDDEWVERGELYSAYREWCYDTGRFPLNRDGFGRDLRSVMPDVMGDGAQKRVGGAKVRVYYGVSVV